MFFLQGAVYRAEKETIHRVMGVESVRQRKFDAEIGKVQSLDGYVFVVLQSGELFILDASFKELYRHQTETSWTSIHASRKDGVITIIGSSQGSITLLRVIERVGKKWVGSQITVQQHVLSETGVEGVLPLGERHCVLFRNKGFWGLGVVEFNLFEQRPEMNLVDQVLHGLEGPVQLRTLGEMAIVSSGSELYVYHSVKKALVKITCEETI